MNEGYKAYISNQATLRRGVPVTDVPAFLQPVHALKGGEKKSSSGTGESGEVKASPKGEVPFLEDYRTVMVQRAVFQSLASMGLPAFTIHSVHNLPFHRPPSLSAGSWLADWKVL